MITYEDFKKMEIKIGKVLSAEKVEGADKLIKLEVDLGAEKRQLVAGVGGVYEASQLVGKEVPVLVNLEPRKIRGVESFGMMLVANAVGKPILMHPDSEVPPGTEVR